MGEGGGKGECILKPIIAKGGGFNYDFFHTPQFSEKLWSPSGTQSTIAP